MNTKRRDRVRKFAASSMLAVIGFGIGFGVHGSATHVASVAHHGVVVTDPGSIHAVAVYRNQHPELFLPKDLRPITCPSVRQPYVRPDYPNGYTCK